MFVSSDRTRSRRQAWLIALLLYALGVGIDVAHHLIDDFHNGNQAIEVAEVAVAFSAGLFWPVDLIAMSLLAMR